MWAKVRQTGHSAAVTLSKTALDTLGVRVGDLVEIEPRADGTVVLYAVTVQRRENPIASAAAQEVTTQWRSVYERLAPTD
ncbi:MAG: hypothetical protein CL878_03890 [Dehalococcoidia bacterium]|nr:hypothetical protein [Dehalococcoidia bacterium]